MLPIPLLYKVIGIGLMIAALFAAYGAWHHHIYQSGVDAENTRWLKIESDAKAKAESVLAVSNGKVKALQAILDDTQSKLTAKLKGLQDAKVTAASLTSDLRSGAKRMSVRASAPAGCPTGSLEGSAPVNDDHGTEITADLDPALAADIANDYATGDQAIMRLNACIESYDAVKAAADALNKP